MVHSSSLSMPATFSAVPCAQDRLILIMTNQQNEVIKDVVDALKKSVSIHGASVDILSRLISILGTIVRAINIIFIILYIIIVRLFYWSYVEKLFNYFGNSWSTLSEGYKILILTIPVGIIITLISHFIIKKLDSFKTKAN